MQEEMVDVPDSLWLQDHFASHANPRAKIARLVRRGKLHRLKRGLYIHTRSSEDAVTLCRAANRLYGPSYVSFVYALSWYGLIPEHAAHITSATLNKGRKKRYDTPAGSFFYQDVPVAAYPHGITLIGDAPARFLMACPEKALCDELYRASGIRSIKGIQDLLFENLRLDPFQFEQLDVKAMEHFAGYYHASTLKTFISFLEQNCHA